MLSAPKVLISHSPRLLLPPTAILALALTACAPLLPQPTPTPPQALTFDSDLAYEHALAQCALGPRPTGSEVLVEAKEYISEQLEAYGWQVEVQEFEFRGLPVQNIIATRGQGPVLILGAHYDTRPRADRDPELQEEPIIGGNDGASGVAVLLELARVLADAPLENEVWLVFFDAEDRGNIDGWPFSVGARYLAENLEIQPEAVIVVDMVGDADQQIYYEGNSNPVLQQEIWDLAADLGYGDVFIPEVRYTLLDDHVPFTQRFIRSALIIDFDYAYWHTVEDTCDKVSAESLERVGRVLEVFVKGS